ncbi:hypothetical protein DHW03_11785 [Pedobacter yonginense]|uniref:Uncharacterized protein n=1 Tax=Pedobacter yonginense TaxID=651869 RepID=A0A317EIQ1_9SPHI|nr:hypothetical protein [Pedobacter yonginense]PWS26710.1 hypothetical protein DHW03_11785 [Pedobacter yonginense]
MRIELIQEFEQLQQSRANKFADELTDKFLSSVDSVNEKITSSLSKRGKMLFLLEKRLNLSTLKRFSKKYLKY